MRVIKSPQRLDGSERANGNEGATSTSDQDGYLSLKALSSYAGLSVRTLRSHLQDPIAPLPHFRIGGRILVRRSEFDVWVGRFRATGASALDGVVNDVMSGLL